MATCTSNGSQPDNYDLYYGGYGQTTITHEIGHAIGLSHTGDYNSASAAPSLMRTTPSFCRTPTNIRSCPTSTPATADAKGFVNWATGGYYQTPQTPMVHDIAAVQSLYGADLTTRAGDTTYGFH